MASMEIGKLYEIYSTDDDSFSVGYLLYQNDDICIFKSFDNQGREAGIYAFKKKIIIKQKSNIVVKVMSVVISIHLYFNF